MERADPNATTRAFLTYVLVPAWLAAGLLDWGWHRLTKIERHASTHESLTHVLLAAEAGIGIVPALLFEVDAGVMAALLGSALVHQATAMWDVAYTKTRRRIVQGEDHTHSFLEVLPFVAAAFAMFARPEQARAMIGLGAERPRWRFRPNPQPMPPATLLAIVGSGVLGLGPFVEEFVRCRRVRPSLAPQPPAPDRAERAEVPSPP